LYFCGTGDLPAPNHYVQTAEYITPSQNLPTGPAIERSAFGDKPVVLYIGDSGLAKTCIAPPSRVFNFRYDSRMGKAWSDGKPKDPGDPDLAGPLNPHVYRYNDYMMVDRSDLLEEPSDVIKFQLVGSGMALLFGENRAQSPTAEDWKHLVCSAFNLSSDFQFDAIFVSLGTNDLANIVRGSVRRRKIPSTTGDFLRKAEKFLEELSETFNTPVCYIGCGMGSVPLNRIPYGSEKTELVAQPHLSETARKKHLGFLLSMLNATVCDRAYLTYDKEGFIGSETRVVLFGMSPLPCPEDFCIEGTGHYKTSAHSHLGVALHNVIELVSVKLRILAPPPMRQYRLIKTVTDAKRYSDLDGNIKPYQYCTVWTPEELSSMGNILLKSTTNKTGPVLAPITQFPEVINVLKEVKSVPGLFLLGQLVSIKYATGYQSHDPEDHGIVLDCDNAYHGLVYNCDKEEVIIVRHELLTTPKFLMPLTPSMARILSNDILYFCEREAHLRRERVRLQMQQAINPPLGRSPSASPDISLPVSPEASRASSRAASTVPPKTEHDSPEEDVDGDVDDEDDDDEDEDVKDVKDVKCEDASPQGSD
jgi:hypothetical protein